MASGTVAMPAIVSAWLKAQLSLASTLALTLRLGRLLLLRLLWTVGAATTFGSATAVVSAALLESHSICENDWLSVIMRHFQCYGFAQIVSSKYEWGQTLRHLCVSGAP